MKDQPIDGVIKYHCDWTQASPMDVEKLARLNRWRRRLYAFGLIGAYPDGIGFGNISRLWRDQQFVITGSQTGHIESLNGEHFTIVNSWNLSENTLSCTGPIKASSESLTHAAFYEQSGKIGAVIHVHHLEMWKKLKGKVPTSKVEVAYGTPEMAKEVSRLFLESNLPLEKIMVMGGHEEGIISFGKDLDEAGEIILQAFHL